MAASCHPNCTRKVLLRGTFISLMRIFSLQVCLRDIFFLYHPGPPSKGKWRAHKVIKKQGIWRFLFSASKSNFFCFKYINGDFAFSSCKIYILLQASSDSWQFHFFFLSVMIINSSTNYPEIYNQIPDRQKRSEKW